MVPSQRDADGTLHKLDWQNIQSYFQWKWSWKLRKKENTRLILRNIFMLCIFTSNVMLVTFIKAENLTDATAASLTSKRHPAAPCFTSSCSSEKGTKAKVFDCDRKFSAQLQSPGKTSEAPLKHSSLLLKVDFYFFGSVFVWKLTVKKKKNSCRYFGENGNDKKQKSAAFKKLSSVSSTCLLCGAAANINYYDAYGLWNVQTVSRPKVFKISPFVWLSKTKNVFILTH